MAQKIHSQIAGITLNISIILTCYHYKKPLDRKSFLILQTLNILRFEGWGVHDCERTEAAGVQCKEKPPPTTPTPPPTTPRCP